MRAGLRAIPSLSLLTAVCSGDGFSVVMTAYVSSSFTVSYLSFLGVWCKVLSPRSVQLVILGSTRLLLATTGDHMMGQFRALHTGAGPRGSCPQGHGPNNSLQAFMCMERHTWYTLSAPPPPPGAVSLTAFSETLADDLLGG